MTPFQILLITFILLIFCVYADAAFAKSKDLNKSPLHEGIKVAGGILVIAVVLGACYCVSYYVSI